MHIAVHIVWLHEIASGDMTGFMPHRAQCFVFGRVPLWVQNDDESIFCFLIGDALGVVIGKITRFNFNIAQLTTEQFLVRLLIQGVEVVWIAKSLTPEGVADSEQMMARDDSETRILQSMPDAESCRCW